MRCSGCSNESRAGQGRSRKSSLEDWQKEARKLELQGKQEQAEAIRRTILRQTPVPWPVFGEAKVVELLVKVFREQLPGARMKQQLYEYATCHDEPQLATWLAEEAKFDQAANFAQQRPTFGRKTYVSLLRQPFQGHPEAVRAVRERASAADEPDAADGRGGGRQRPAGRSLARTRRRPRRRRPLWLQRAALDAARGIPRCEVRPRPTGRALRTARPDERRRQYRRTPGSPRPASVRVLSSSRRYGFSSSRASPIASGGPTAPFETQAILDSWQHLPANIVRPERNRRSHLSSVLARNEVDRDYAYNRALFKRVAQGWYQFNPKNSPCVGARATRRPGRRSMRRSICR
jgi:hypothetical protein